jgi:hypothetical protein
MDSPTLEDKASGRTVALLNAANYLEAQRARLHAARQSNSPALRAACLTPCPFWAVSSTAGKGPVAALNWSKQSLVFTSRRRLRFVSDYF